MSFSIECNRRILVIDDNQAIHLDLQKAISGGKSIRAEVDQAAASLFDELDGVAVATAVFEIESAFQGQEGLVLVQQAVAEGHPFALAFVDVRMPPGWDGIETIERLWEADPDLQVVICTAYSDYSWNEITKRLGETDQLLILKKPFDNVEVRQMASALTAKWDLQQATRRATVDLERLVRDKTADLQLMNARLREKIVEHVQFEDVLCRAQERTKAIFEAALDGIITIDGKGIIVAFNPAAERIFGFTKAEVVGKEMAPLIIPPNIRGDHQSGMAHFAATGEGAILGKRIEVSAMRKDGSVFPVELAIVPVHQLGATMFTGYIHDITDRKQAEEVLAERLKLLALTADVGDTVNHTENLSRILQRCAELMVQHLDVALARVWTLNPARNILELQASAGMDTQLDGPGGRVPVGELKIGRIAQERKSYITNQVIGDPRVVDQDWAKENGMIAFAGYPLMIEDRLIGVMAMFSKRALSEAVVTAMETVANGLALGIQRKQADQALRATQEQLLQSQKMEAVGQLAGGVAHDFNNLLTIIKSYCEIILDSMDSTTPFREEVKQIRDAGDRAAALTRQLLAFSRKQILEPRLVDVNILLAELKKMLDRLLGDDIELAIHPGNYVGQILVDPGQIEQVIINLAVNARDAMPQGGTLTIETNSIALASGDKRLEADIAPGNYTMITVTDTGCGIENGILARIFEPFFTTKGIGKGTGLGLATVHGIIRQSGGQVTVSSELGVGTVFQIYLPQQSVQKQSASPEVAAARSLRGSETILLVEDEPVLRNLATRILRAKGYTVLAAEHAAAAISLFEEHHGNIDLLLTDVVMSKMSGLQVAEELTTRQPNLRVLFMSGYTDDAVIRHGVRLSEMAFLQKPFTPEGLTAKIRDVLDA
jgi:two-component system cell cycle sensor histidine kinase/response regulator CckA